MRIQEGEKRKRGQMTEKRGERREEVGGIGRREREGRREEKY